MTSGSQKSGYCYVIHGERIMKQLYAISGNFVIQSGKVKTLHIYLFLNKCQTFLLKLCSFHHNRLEKKGDTAFTYFETFSAKYQIFCAFAMERDRTLLYIYLCKMKAT